MKPRPPIEEYRAGVIKAPNNFRVGRLNKEELIDISNYIFFLETAVVPLMRDLNMSWEDLYNRVESSYKNRELVS